MLAFYLVLQRVLSPAISALFPVLPSFDLELIRTISAALTARLNELMSLTNIMALVGHASRSVYGTTVAMINVVRFFPYKEYVAIMEQTLGMVCNTWSSFLFTVSLMERTIGQTLDPVAARFATLSVYATVFIISFSLLIIVVGVMRVLWTIVACIVRTLLGLMWPLVRFIWRVLGARPPTIVATPTSPIRGREASPEDIIATDLAGAMTIYPKPVAMTDLDEAMTIDLNHTMTIDHDDATVAGLDDAMILDFEDVTTIGSDDATALGLDGLMPASPRSATTVAPADVMTTAVNDITTAEPTNAASLALYKRMCDASRKMSKE